MVQSAPPVMTSPSTVQLTQNTCMQQHPIRGGIAGTARQASIVTLPYLCKQQLETHLISVALQRVQWNDAAGVPQLAGLVMGDSCQMSC